MTTCTPRAAWITLLRRFHFYIGLFVGPFIFVAALTGTLYVASPQLEHALYKDALTGSTSGENQPLASQVAIAEQVTDGHLKISAVRPALIAGETTRVMFADPQLGESESRAVFIDPVTLSVKGDLTVYGTSGILPFRQWIDYAHRSLLLGNPGRIYSELAASWLWVAALGGIVLWFYTRPKRRINNRVQKTRRLHTGLGWGLLAGMLLFSATGLTWSQWAGGNVDKMRAAFGWLTPQVNTLLSKGKQAHDPHADHHMHHAGMTMPVEHIELPLFDKVLQSAQREGIRADKLEIRPPRDASRAWTVTEIDRSWPTRVDAVAVDGASLQVIDHTRFEDYPLMAKLTRWGVDFHMGVLFGLANQWVLIAFGLALCVAILLGYRLWWLRRPQGALINPGETLSQSWLALPLSGRLVTLCIAMIFGAALPIMGASLIAFLLVDVIRWRQARQRTVQQNA
jgi:uncharacterized iron-regulated membrane protein